MSDIDQLIEWMRANQYVIDTDLLEKAKDLQEVKICSFSKTLQAISEYTKISLDEMKGTTRKHEVAFARHLAFFLGYQDCKKTLVFLGNYFNRDHTTVMNSKWVIQGFIDTKDEKTLTALQEIKNLLKGEINS